MAEGQPKHDIGNAYEAGRGDFSLYSEGEAGRYVYKELIQHYNPQNTETEIELTDEHGFPQCKIVFGNNTVDIKFIMPVPPQGIKKHYKIDKGGTVTLLSENDGPYTFTDEYIETILQTVNSFIRKKD